MSSSEEESISVAVEKIKKVKKKVKKIQSKIDKQLDDLDKNPKTKGNDTLKSKGAV